MLILHLTRIATVLHYLYLYKSNPKSISNLTKTYPRGTDYRDISSILIETATGNLGAQL